MTIAGRGRNKKSHQLHQLVGQFLTICHYQKSIEGNHCLENE